MTTPDVEFLSAHDMHKCRYLLSKGVCLSVCLSLRLSRSRIVSKRLNLTNRIALALHENAQLKLASSPLWIKQ